jgi:hypothetical protein
VGIVVPIIEIANDGNLLRVWRPHAERSSGFPIEGSEMRPELVIGAVIPAFVKEVEVVCGKATDVTAHGR